MKLDAHAINLIDNFRAEWDAAMRGDSGAHDRAGHAASVLALTLSIYLDVDRRRAAVDAARDGAAD
jgi:hypothetical protein